MDVTRRKAAPSKQIQALTDTNAALQADNAKLEKDNADLKLTCELQKQKIKSLQVAVSILLGSAAGLAIGMAGVAASPLLTTAITVSIAVISLSIAILTFMRR